MCFRELERWSHRCRCNCSYSRGSCEIRKLTTMTVQSRKSASTFAQSMFGWIMGGASAIVYSARTSREKVPLKTAKSASLNPHEFAAEIR